MATPFPTIATKATLVGAVTGALVHLKNIKRVGYGRGEVPTSTMDTQDAETFDPLDLKTPGTFEWDGLYDGTDLGTLLLGAAAEDWTLTFRTGGTPTTLKCKGFHTGVELEGPMEDLWIYSGTIVLSGADTHT